MASQCLFDFEGIARKLRNNAQLFANLKQTGQMIKPIGLSICTTLRCNSHCIMCNIWKLSRNATHLAKKEMTCSEILSYLRDSSFTNLVEIDLNGGEPYLREDLEDIVSGLVKLKKECLPYLKTIIIPTNGFLTEQILTTTQSILEKLAGEGIDLVNSLSLDGVGKTHDKQRGTKNAYHMARNTMQGMKELQKKYGQMYWPGIKTTVTRYNINELDSILDLAEQNNFFHIISPVIISQSRFKNEQAKDEIQLRSEDMEKIVWFYKRNNLESEFYYFKMLESFSEKGKAWTCTGLFNYIFIDYNGKIYPCPLLDIYVGDLTTHSATHILLSERAQNIRKEIDHYPMCTRCTEPGAFRYSTVLTGDSFLSFLSTQSASVIKKNILNNGLIKLI